MILDQKLSNNQKRFLPHLKNHRTSSKLFSCTLHSAWILDRIFPPVFVKCFCSKTFFGISHVSALYYFNPCLAPFILCHPRIVFLSNAYFLIKYIYTYTHICVCMYTHPISVTHMYMELEMTT